MKIKNISRLIRTQDAERHRASLSKFPGKMTFTEDFCCCTVTKSCLTLCDPTDCSTPDFSILHCLLEFAQTHVYWVSNAIQPSHLLPLPSPLVLNLSQHQGVFQWVSSLHRWPKYWSFSLNISPSNGYSGLISFRIDWFDLAIQGILSRVFSNITVQ